VSPDGSRLAFVDVQKSGPMVRVISAQGGLAREVIGTETVCSPGWSSEKTIWVSRRLSGKLVWMEVDADSGKETGRSVPGSRDCSDGHSDPDSPVDPTLRIVEEQRSQVRLLPGEYIPGL
jgi:hypothetical protein